jgi:hypothetical protein
LVADEQAASVRDSPDARRIDVKIPPYRLVLEPMDDEARSHPPGFKWAAPPVGQRHRLGGSPDFIQEVEWPSCPRCAKAMTFYAQLDSLNDDIVLGDVGMVYLFICFDCLEVEALLQTS